MLKATLRNAHEKFSCEDESNKRFRSRMVHEQVHMNSVTPSKRSEQNKIPIRQLSKLDTVRCDDETFPKKSFFSRVRERSIKVLIARQANNRLFVDLTSLLD